MAHFCKWVGLALLLSLALSACGGGGGGGGAGVSSTGSPGNAALVAYPASLATLNDANVVPVVVESGPGRNVNMPYVTVTVCSPGTNHCQAINNVLLDTGSTGLRLFASQIDPAVVLPPQRIGDSSSISECAQFLSMVAWGPVRQADVVMGGERAEAVPIQLMDANFAPLPTDCGDAPLVASSTGSRTKALYANGILGVGLFVNDGQIYFNCASPDAACQFSPPVSQQVQNPVRAFAVNNNGIAIQLPSLSEQGANQAQGYLIFGVGTQSNNQLGAAHVVPVDPSSGFFTTFYKGRTLNNSMIDSGSNGLYFDDAQVFPASCTRPVGFYCPDKVQHLSASIALAASSAAVSFQIANASALFAPGTNLAFNNLGGPGGDSFFNWGLPFFFGRTVYTVIEGQQVRQGARSLPGPFHAFSD
jgi:hypothetical protein